MKVTAFSANKFLKENSQDLTHFPKAVTAVMPLYDSLFPTSYLISISISLHMGQDWTLRRQGLQVTWPFLPGYIFFNHTKVFFSCIFFSHIFLTGTAWSGAGRSSHTPGTPGWPELRDEYFVEWNDWDSLSILLAKYSPLPWDPPATQWPGSHAPCGRPHPEI